MSGQGAGMHPGATVHLARAQVALEALLSYLTTVSESLGGEIGPHVADMTRQLLGLAQEQLDGVSQYTEEPSLSVLTDAALWLVRSTLR